MSARFTERLCACGCGERFASDRKNQLYKHGHKDRARGHKRLRVRLREDELRALEARRRRLAARSAVGPTDSRRRAKPDPFRRYQRLWLKLFAAETRALRGLLRYRPREEAKHGIL